MCKYIHRVIEPTNVKEASFKISFFLLQKTLKYTIISTSSLIELDAVDSGIDLSSSVGASLFLRFFMAETFSLGHDEIFVGLGSPRIKALKKGNSKIKFMEVVKDC